MLSGSRGGRRSPAAYARFLRVLAEDDDVEGGAGEDLDGAQGVGESVTVVVVVEAGRAASKAGRIPRKRYASASSPVDGLID